jgi:hypothetical protein
MTVDTRPTALGRALQFREGDLRLVDGDFAIVAGPENFMQAMQVMIETPFGTDVFNVNYGFGLLGSLGQAGTVGFIKDLIRLHIVKSLTQDNRVREIVGVTFDDEPAFYRLLPDEDPAERRRARKERRQWKAAVVLKTVRDDEVAFAIEGAGLKP